MQAEISIQRSRIHECTEKIGGVSIITEHQRYDFPGAHVFPGFVDSHAHIVGLGMKLRDVALYEAASEQACLDILRNITPNRGDWILGMGWNQELWETHQYPDNTLLNELFPTTPVYLRRADGHAAWVNKAALLIAGITAETPNPDGGSIVKNSTGIPTGILVDNAMDLIAKHIPQPSIDEIKQYIQTSLHTCASVGITEIHDMDVPPEYIEIYREMAEQGLLPCRVQTWVRGQHNEWQTYGTLPAVGEFQQTIGVKFYSDGALGSRGALLLEDYSDDPGNKGLALITHQDLYTKCKDAIETGFHVCTHAIGDAANRMVIDVYEQLRSEGIATDDVLLRIEHTQILHPDDVQRLQQNNLIASVQPIHCSSDAYMAEKRLSERCAYAYPWQTLLNHNIAICAGSDFPIESHNPLLGIYCFCTRYPFHSVTSWYPNEVITREHALSAYTTWAHRAADMNYKRGMLQSGYDADLVVWDRDLITCSIEELVQAKVLATFTAGRCVYKSE